MDAQWWRNAVIYQIYLRSFSDGDGDGVGDLAGLAEKLDYVASLGVDAMWITPFFASPMADFGYDVADYTTIDPLFGGQADFARVVARAHGLGLKIILDMVWGHTSDRHAWFVDSRAGGPKKDWYVWADPRPDGTPPNNWLSVFGGAAWTWEPRRRQYYLHHFLAAQPALNWRHPEVVAALLEVGRFWRERGVDGFRLDAVDFLVHDRHLRDNPTRPLDAVPARPFGMQHHQFDMVQPEALEMFERIRGLGVVTMAELSSVGDPLARAAAYTAPRRLDLAYSLGLMRRPFTVPALKAAIAEAASVLGNGGMVWSFSNHDIERPVTRWGDDSPDSARMMLALLLSLDGAICLYQGEELGLPEADIPFDRLRDPYGIAFWPDYKGRDGCRTPMPWESRLPAIEPWLPVPDSHRARAVAVQEGDGASVLNTVRRLLRWRNRHPALLAGRTVMVEMGEDVLAFERVAPGERMLCLFNPSAQVVRVRLPGPPVEGVGYRIDGNDLVFDCWGAAFVPL